MKVRITTKPPKHGTGRDSGPCTCVGKTGTLLGLEIVHGEELAIVRLDKGGRIGVPSGCLIADVKGMANGLHLLDTKA